MDLFAWVLDTPSWALLLGVIALLLTAGADGSITEGMTLLQVVAVVAVASHAAYNTVLHDVAGGVETRTSPSPY